MRILFLLVLLLGHVGLMAAEPVTAGSRRELFVDDTLVERLAGRAELRLYPPTPREVGLETSEAWEGNSTNYVTVFPDGDKFRMYYRGSHFSFLGGKDRPNTRDTWFCGDDLERTVIWAGDPDLDALAGKPVRLRFEVKDADLYSFRFRAGD